MRKEEIMKLKKVTCTATLLLLLIASIRSSGEFQITTDSHNQQNPAIHGDIVVWTDERINPNIHGYDMSTNQEFQITTDIHVQQNPAIYNDIVVWEDTRNGNKDIYGYNLSRKEEFRITRGPSNKGSPAVYGDYVIWQDEERWDIYGYNLLTGQEFSITTDDPGQWGPSIYGDIVVWADERNGKSDIYGYNLSTRREFQITTNPANQQAPALSGEYVVWEDDRNGNWDIYGYNLSTQKEFRITTNPANQQAPAIYGNIVVWHDHRYGSWDICYYNLFTKQESRITTNTASQIFPAVYEKIVVWQDDRNGNQDIYGYNFSLASLSTDRDLDGYLPPEDCNNNDATVHPRAYEFCDNKDNDCDGYIDEGYDLDYDGYTTCGGDCNDSDPQIHPGASESCGKDYNCDGTIIPCGGVFEITVSSEGEGLQAKVYIDGVYEGKTNAQGSLIISNLKADKEYTIRVECEGYPSTEKKLKTAKDTTVKVDIVMKRTGIENIVPFVVLPIILLVSALLILKLKKRSKGGVPEPQIAEKPEPEKPEIKETLALHTVICPFCKNEIQEDWIVCPHCATKLKDDTQVY